MSSIFYTREPGTDGQILSGEGVAPGVGLDQLLDRDRPPLRAALEIGSAVADILCIASEDGHVHGDIRPAHVKLDAAGAVSIEGYGIVRRLTRAPEGRPDLPPADIYGLGLVMHASLSKEGMGTLPADADGHDDAVVDRVLAMDFSSVSTKRWLAEVREFLCKILAYDPRDRPAALDAANVLATVAGQCPGEGVADWSARAHLRLSGGRPPARQVEENLAGPVSLPGYFKGGVAAETVPQRDSVRKAPSSKGESTAMWSREKLAAMFAEEDEDDAASAPVRAAPPKADPPAPRSRHDLPAEPVRTQNLPPPRVAPPMATPATTLPVVPAAPPQPAAPRPPAAQPVPAVVQPRPVIVQQDLDEPEAAESGSNSMVIIGAVVALLVVLCAGVGLLGGGYFLMEKKGEEASARPGDVMASDAPAPAVEPVVAAPLVAAPAVAAPVVAPPVAEPAVAEPAVAPPVAAPAVVPPVAAPAVAAPVAAPPATAKPVAASPVAAPPVRPAAASAPAASAPAAAANAKKPPVAAPATPAAAPASTATSTTTFPVKFTAPGREGKVRCGDGQTVSFSGATTLSFGGTTTCLVQIDQGRGAVQVTRSTTVTCTEDAGKVVCAGGN